MYMKSIKANKVKVLAFRLSATIKRLTNKTVNMMMSI